MAIFIERPASKRSLARRRLVLGVGINDAKYTTSSLDESGKRIVCPFYQRWLSMLTRCYSVDFKKKNPTYSGCIVIDDWHKFSNFKKWMAKNDWEGKQLDKDILVLGNKIYSPEFCVFISARINTLLNNNESIRGEYPIGVSLNAATGKYVAHCKDSGKKKYVGIFFTINEAESAYCKFKSNLIKAIASESEALSSTKIKKALLTHAKNLDDRSLILAGLK